MTCWATSLAQCGQRHLEPHGQAEGPVVVAAQRDVGDDLGVGGVDLHGRRDQLQRRVEAGGVAGGEQLLGVGGAALAAELLGGADGGVDGAVEGLDVAVAAVPGRDGRGGVEEVHARNLIVHNQIVQVWTGIVEG